MSAAIPALVMLCAAMLMVGVLLGMFAERKRQKKIKVKHSKRKNPKKFSVALDMDEIDDFRKEREAERNKESKI